MQVVRFAMILGAVAAGPAPGATPTYFAPGTFRADSGGDISGMLDARFGEALGRLREPSLADAARADPHRAAFRALILPTWGQPEVVRVERAAGRTTVRWATLDGDGGYEIGQIADDRTSSGAPGDWEGLVALATTHGFATMPTRVDELGSDGTDWLIEGVAQGRHHVVYRWSPGKGRPERELGRAILALGDPSFAPRPARPGRWLAFAVMLVLGGVAIAGVALGLRRRPGGSPHREGPARPAQDRRTL